MSLWLVSRPRSNVVTTSDSDVNATSGEFLKLCSEFSKEEDLTLKIYQIFNSFSGVCWDVVSTSGNQRCINVELRSFKSRPIFDQHSTL